MLAGNKQGNIIGKLHGNSGEPPRKMKILLSYFTGPFYTASNKEPNLCDVIPEKEEINISEIIAEELKKEVSPLSDHALSVKYVELPVTDECNKIIVTSVCPTNPYGKQDTVISPDIVIMLGEGVGNEVCIETEAKYTYFMGAAHPGKSLKTYFAEGINIPVNTKVSTDAGGFYCESVYYHALNIKKDKKCLFIHLPFSDKQHNNMENCLIAGCNYDAFRAEVGMLEEQKILKAVEAIISQVIFMERMENPDKYV